MIRRASVIAIELVAGLVGVIVIAAAILFWRLLTGPVSLGFATPYIERALSVEKPAIEVRIQEMELAWTGWDRVFDLRARNAAILGPEGKLLATLPEVSMGLSLAGLMRGVIAPKHLEIRGLSASVERARDGGVALGFFFGEDSAADVEFVNRLPGYIAKLTDTHDPDSSFGYLRSVRVTDVDLEFLDHLGDAKWVAPDTDIELVREADVIEVVASTDLAFGERSTRMTAHLVFGRDRPTVDLAFDFERLVPADFAERVPELARLRRLAIPFSGQLRVLAQQDGTVNSVAFDLESAHGAAAGNVIADGRGGLDLTAMLTGIEPPLVAGIIPGFEKRLKFEASLDAKVSGTLSAGGAVRRLAVGVEGGAGSFELVGQLPQPVEYDRLRLDGTIEGDFADIRVERAEIDVGGTTLSASLSAHRLGETMRARIDATLGNLSMAALDRYWPNDVGVEARSWTTENIRAGIVEEGTLGLVLQLPADGFGEVEVQSLSGGLKYRDLEVSYFAGLPKATGVAGTASFARDRFDLDIKGGKLRDVRLDHGTINMTRLDTDSEAAAIELLLRGPLATALDVIDREPLRYISDLGLEPKEIGGDMVMRLDFRFPLRSDLTTRDVEVGASADLRGMRMVPGPFGYRIEDGNLELILSGGTMKVAGNVALNGVPVSVDWHEEFNPGTPFRSRYILSGRIDRDAMRRLGLPETRFVKGPAEVNVILTRFDDGRAEVLVGGDLAAMVLSVPELGWLKPSGRPASLSMEMSVDRTGKPSIERLAAKAEDLDLEARVTFDAVDASRWQARIGKLVLGRSRLDGWLRRTGPNAYELVVEGPLLDIEPFLLDNEPEAREMPSPKPDNEVALSIDARVDAIRLGPDGRFAATELQARYAGATLDALSLESRMPEKGTFRLGYLPENAGHRLDVHTDDAGRALKSLGWSDKMEGGTLAITGSREKADAPLRGAFKLSNYKISRAPVLARLLQVASLTGIFDALQRGLDFVSFDGAFEYRNDILWILQSRTFGSSLGITVEGSVDLDEDTAELKGTIVPAYTVNRVLGKIPILGPLLTGGEEEGLFAATYAVTGPLDDPAIAVNPLSALAPGFLRKLFGRIGDDKQSEPPPVIPKTAE